MKGVGKIMEQNNKHEDFSIKSTSRVICTLYFLDILWIFVLGYKTTKSEKTLPKVEVVDNAAFLSFIIPKLQGSKLKTKIGTNPEEDLVSLSLFSKSGCLFSGPISDVIYLLFANTHLNWVCSQMIRKWLFFV